MIRATRSSGVSCVPVRRIFRERSGLHSRARERRSFPPVRRSHSPVIMVRADPTLPRPPRALLGARPASIRATGVTSRDGTFLGRGKARHRALRRVTLAGSATPSHRAGRRGSAPCPCERPKNPSRASREPSLDSPRPSPARSIVAANHTLTSRGSAPHPRERPKHPTRASREPSHDSPRPSPARSIVAANHTLTSSAAPPPSHVSGDRAEEGGVPKIPGVRRRHRLPDEGCAPVPSSLSLLPSLTTFPGVR